MSMRAYQPMHLSPMLDSVHRNELLKVDKFLRQISANMARTPQAPAGTPSSGGAQVDLSNYLYLPGRSPKQRAFGNNTFSMKNNAQISATSDADVYGFALEGLNDTSGNLFKETIYFSGDYVAGKSLVRRWIFPSISGSDADNFVFVATSGSQTISGKILTSGQIYVGTAAGRNLFVNAGNNSQQFTITPNTSFPTIGTQTPNFLLPKLDQAEPLSNSHSFMVLESTSNTPFVKGSIAHGNVDASEMEMLAAGVNGSVLQYNVGQTLTVTWTAGDTNLFSGLVDSTLTKSGMRVRGGSSASLCVPRDAIITGVNNGVSFQIDQPLVGNGSGGVSVTTYGPIWSTSLSGVDHGGLAGLTDDDHTQYLHLSGRSGGQRIGNGTHSGATQASDLAIEGQLLIDHADTNTAFTAETALDIRTRHPGAMGNVVNISSNLASATTASDFIGISLNVNGSLTSGGSNTVRGFSFSNVGTVGASTIVTESIAGRFTSTFGTISTGVLDKVVGIRSQAVGTNNASTHVNGVTGIEVDINQRAGTTTLKGIHMRAASGTQSGAVSSYVGVDWGTSAILNSNTIVDYLCIQIPDAPTNPTGTIRGLAIGAIKSHHTGQFRFGDTTTPTHSIEIAAGTTTRAPLRLTSGTSLTSPAAGTIEFTTDDFFATITTGPARKAFVLDDGTRLTSGRVPFATTNGRLTDDPDMTFATDTLTVTKIGATQFVGDVQFTGSGFGWPYGSCYGNEIGWTQAAAAAGTFYEVSDTDMTDGELNNVTHDGNGKLTVTIAGRYLITYSVSLEADAANIHLVSAISVNGTEISPGRNHFHRASASAAIPLASTAIVSLAANDTIEVAVATADAGTPTLSVEHLNISVLQIGG